MFGSRAVRKVLLVSAPLAAAILLCVAALITSVSFASAAAHTRADARAPRSAAGNEEAVLYLPRNFARPEQGMHNVGARPRAFIIGSEDAVLHVRRLRWRRWNAVAARAHGQARWCEYDVVCTGRWVHYVIVVRRPVNYALGCRGRWYTKLRAKADGEIWGDIPVVPCA